MNNITKFAILIFIALLTINVGIVVGSADIAFFDTFNIILSKITGKNTDQFQTSASIIWSVRLPRVFLAFIVGMCLSIGGTIVQSVLKNSLASPYTIGVSSASSLMVSIVIISGGSVAVLGIFFQSLVGFLAGLLAVFIVILFARSIDKNLSGTTVILAGMVFSLFYNAIQMILTSISQDSLKQVIMWQMGSFAMRGWKFVIVIIPFFLIGLIGALKITNELDIMTLGDEQARSIGVDTSKSMKIALTLATILTGASVAVCGTIGFVDLITPHIGRKIFGSKHKYVIPASALLGGTLMVLADLIARTVLSPSELPVGAITALIGAPFFTYIYFKGKR